MRGSGKRKVLVKFSIIPRESEKGLINQALLKLTVKNCLGTRFVKTTMELAINQEKLLSQPAGGAIKSVVSVDQMKEMELYIPALLEQEKIAPCFSLFDELITSQSQKIDTLKQHKKAFMQQIFPPPTRQIDARSAAPRSSQDLAKCVYPASMNIIE
jgi:type I restriction enzyme S subunit